MAKKVNKHKKTFLDNTKLMSGVILVLYFIWILLAGSVELTFINFLGHFLFLMTILILNYQDFKRCFKEIAKKPVKNILLILLLAVIVFVIANGGRMVCSLIIGDTGVDSSNAALQQIFDIKPLGTLYVTFLTIFFYPIVEETVFRGSIKSIISNKWLFIIISVIASWYFQTVSINPTIEELAYAVPTIFVSLFSAILYTKKNNILYVILPRVAYNLIIGIIQLSMIL